MKARSNFCLFLALLIALAHGSLPAAAQSPIKVTENELTFNLPAGMAFSLAANSTSDIQKVSLLYDTESRSCHESTARRPLQIIPGKSVDARWEMDFQQMGALLPGQKIWWQWEIIDSAGNRLLTEKQTRTIQDQRHDWQTAVDGAVTVQWYRGGQEFGERMAQIGAEAQQRLMKDTGIPQATPIRLVLYPDTTTLKEVLVHAMTWTGGVALVGESVILLAIGPSDSAWAETSIPHEVSHLVVDEQTANCAGVSIPTWLNEGIAERVSSDLQDSERSLVITSLENNSLKSLKALGGQFSAYSNEAARDYAHSHMVVDFLIDQYGSEKMSQLLDAFLAGTDTDEALLQVYGMDTAGLDAAWRSSLGFPVAATQPPAATAKATAIPTLALWTPVVQPSPTPPASAATPTVVDTPVPTPTERVTLSPAATETPAAGRQEGDGSGLCGAFLPILAAALWISLRHYRRLGN